MKYKKSLDICVNCLEPKDDALECLINVFT